MEKINRINLLLALKGRYNKPTIVTRDTKEKTEYYFEIGNKRYYYYLYRDLSINEVIYEIGYSKRFGYYATKVKSRTIKSLKEL